MYLDVLFFINFAVDALLLLAVARLTAAPLSRRRILSGALTGAAAAVALWFVGDAPGLPLLRAACALLTTAAAFGAQSLRPALLRAGVLYAVSCALAGLYLSMQVRLTIAFLVFASLGIALLCRALSQLRAKPDTAALCAVELVLDGRSITLQALRDTGHSLADPVTNRPVLVVSCDAVSPLLPPAAAAVLQRCGAADAPALLAALSQAGVRGFTLVPYRSVGQPGGLLPAFAPSRALLDGREASVLVAISPTALSESYDALMGAA